MNKVIKPLLISVILLIILFMPSINAFASTIYLTDDGVNIRLGAGTTYEKIGTTVKGETYETYNLTLTLDGTNGCDSGKWYQIDYSGSKGYICSTFTTTSVISTTVDEYFRPWVSPKKAIEGGALYIVKYYIAKGQDSIYLKKFNVSPNAVNSAYTHQYQTNIMAPTSEAYRSYQGYLENNLLDQPLIFEIPIYNDMPVEASKKPGGTSNTSGIIMEDSAFETKLDAEGFNESYKKKLRELHILHPNWIFKSLDTSLDWNNSVKSEQPNSYIYSYNNYNIEMVELNSSGYPILKEGTTWFLANEEATAYYLDPRNFLTEDSILMFEKLSYSALYTEEVVQSFLIGTFMSGISVIDEITYANIFVEAGKNANISPIYLASLAIQEVGVTGSTSTTGAQFIYNDDTYVGLYNYFNIGAYSTAINPALAGLYWANAGSTATLVTGYVSSVEESLLSKFGLSKTNGYIFGLSLNQTVGQLKAKNSTSIKVVDSEGNELLDKALIATDSRIIVTSSDGSVYTNTVVIPGDINGDGKITPADLLYIRRNLLEVEELSGAKEQAAHIAKKEKITPADLLYLRKFLFDPILYNITQ